MIQQIDLDNLDGFANYDYYKGNVNDIEMLQKQVQALAERLNVVIDLLNKGNERNSDD